MPSPYIEGLDGDFFVQTARSENWSHLDCLAIADLPLPLGELVNVYCSGFRKGTVRVVGQIRGDPGVGTTTITRPLSSTVNWLFENRCPFEGLVTWACDGSREIPENYEVAVVVFNVNPTQVSIAAPVVRERGEDVRIDTPAEVSYTGLYLVYHLSVNVVTISNTAPANGIVFLPEACESKCASARGACAEGYMALDGTLYDSEVKYATTGVNWEQTTTDPFEDGGDAGPLVVFPLYDGHRVIVGRISTSTHLGAEVAISENWGVTWSNVDVSALVGQIFGRNGLFRYGGRVWAALSGGYIYMSSDLGDTWTLQDSGTVTDNLNGIVMYNLETGYAVGDANAFLYTVNGSDWYARTGPFDGVNLLSVAVNDKGDVFVGATDGNLYRSEDGGQNWLQTDGVTAGAWRQFGIGSIDWIAFDEETRYFGFLIYNPPTGAGTVYRSINGGATWRAPATGQVGQWNSGLNSGHICDQNHAFVVGETHSGNTLIAQIEPS